MECTQLFLVYSEEFPEGIRLDFEQYELLVMSMGHTDFIEHIAVEIPPGFEDMSDQAIFMARSRKKVS